MGVMGILGGMGELGRLGRWGNGGDGGVGILGESGDCRAERVLGELRILGGNWGEWGYLGYWGCWGAVDIGGNGMLRVMGILGGVLVRGQGEGPQGASEGGGNTWRGTLGGTPGKSSQGFWGHTHTQ